jgi:hypothetical protein
MIIVLQKNFKLTAGFLVFFIVTESIMSWDWIMSVDPHWVLCLDGMFCKFLCKLNHHDAMDFVLKSRF